MKSQRFNLKIVSSDIKQFHLECDQKSTLTVIVIDDKKYDFLKAWNSYKTSCKLSICFTLRVTSLEHSSIVSSKSSTYATIYVNLRGKYLVMKTSK